MANMTRKITGKGGPGSARTVDADAQMGPNQVLSNRDKQQHSKERGKDGKAIETEQLQDSESNQGGE